MELEDGARIIQGASGTHFDAKVVDVFMKHYRENLAGEKQDTPDSPEEPELKEGSMA